MKLIIYSATLMLLLVLANCEDFCTTYVSQYNRFRTECDLETHMANVTTCCDLRVFQFREIRSISGVYPIRRGSFDTASAFCDMDTTDGGWIVIQRNRMGSSVNFNRNFTDYEEGFGDLNSDFWYGLEAVECLTQRSTWEMRIDYEFMNGTRSYVQYSSFRIDTARADYRILSLSQYQGIGRDIQRELPNVRFSTPDNDNDFNRTANCAELTRSGFWFTRTNQCGSVNLNAQPPHIEGVNVRFVEMKIRQLNCDTE